MKLKLLIPAIIGFASPAFAETDAQEYTRFLQSATVNIVQAMDAAKTKVNGTVVKAELDDYGNKVVYEVDVLDGSRLFEVRIDAANGNVLNVVEETD